MPFLFSLDGSGALEPRPVDGCRGAALSGCTARPDHDTHVTSAKRRQPRCMGSSVRAARRDDACGVVAATATRAGYSRTAITAPLDYAPCTGTAADRTISVGAETCLFARAARRHLRNTRAVL